MKSKRRELPADTSTLALLFVLLNASRRRKTVPMLNPDPPAIESDPALCSNCEEPCKRIEDDALTGVDCNCCAYCSRQTQIDLAELAADDRHEANRAA